LIPVPHKLGALSEEKVIEKWRIYDPVVACEKFIETGKIKEIRA